MSMRRVLNTIEQLASTRFAERRHELTMPLGGPLVQAEAFCAETYYFVGASGVFIENA